MPKLFSKENIKKSYAAKVVPKFGRVVSTTRQKTENCTFFSKTFFGFSKLDIFFLSIFFFRYKVFYVSLENEQRNHQFLTFFGHFLMNFLGWLFIIF